MFVGLKRTNGLHRLQSGGIILYLPNSNFKIHLFQCHKNIQSLVTVLYPCEKLSQLVHTIVLYTILIIEVFLRTSPKVLSLLKHMDIDVSNLR
jgi:F0F1-type ATP synthase assembly protein I